MPDTGPALDDGLVEAVLRSPLSSQDGDRGLESALTSVIVRAAHSFPGDPSRGSLSSLGRRGVTEVGLAVPEWMGLAREVCGADADTPTILRFISDHMEVSKRVAGKLRQNTWSQVSVMLCGHPEYVALAKELYVQGRIPVELLAELYG